MPVIVTRLLAGNLTRFEITAEMMERGTDDIEGTVGNVVRAAVAIART